MDRKWTLFDFSCGDFKEVERYLNEQAEKGWELQKLGFLARWQRTSRKNLTYCVDIANPNADEKEEKHYTELCAEGGWVLIGKAGGMLIFKSAEGEVPIPIQTDAVLELENYKQFYIRNMLRKVVGVSLILALCALILVFRGSWSELISEYGIGLKLWVWLIAVCGQFLLILWKIADFIWVVLRNREQNIACPPRWALWVNNICTKFSLFFSIVIMVIALT